MAELILPLDAATGEDALGLVDRLGADATFYKVGPELYLRAGPHLVRELRSRDKRVFLDLKLHDNPTTVASAVEAALALDVQLLSVHISGGTDMLTAAVEAAASR